MKCIVIVVSLVQLDAATWRCIAFYSRRIQATASIFKVGMLSEQRLQLTMVEGVITTGTQRQSAQNQHIYQGDQLASENHR